METRGRSDLQPRGQRWFNSSQDKHKAPIVVRPCRSPTLRTRAQHPKAQHSTFFLLFGINDLRVRPPLHNLPAHIVQEIFFLVREKRVLRLGTELAASNQSDRKSTSYKGSACPAVSSGIQLFTPNLLVKHTQDSGFPGMTVTPCLVTLHINSSNTRGFHSGGCAGATALPTPRRPLGIFAPESSCPASSLFLSKATGKRLSATSTPRSLKGINDTG